MTKIFHAKAQRIFATLRNLAALRENNDDSEKNAQECDAREAK